MKRKVILTPPNTYLVTLPADWVRQFNISKGDEIEMIHSGNSLVISTQSIPAQKNIVLDISSLDERVVRWCLSAIHKSGYDQIDVKYRDKGQLALIYKLMKDLFTGFNIVSETENSVVLKPISNESKGEFDAAFRRAFRVALSMGNELLDCLKENYLEKLNILKEKELLNNQLNKVDF